MPEWLQQILADLPTDAHWSTRRRMAILQRWPLGRQAEAQADAAVGKPALRDQMVAEIEAIKAAIPSGVIKLLADLKDDKRADLIADCESAISAIRAGYPESEVLSWSKQEAEARALVADANAATPLLDALAEARGIAKAELADRVIAKADAFAAISGALIGKRQRLEDELDALPSDATPDHVAKIVW